MATVKLKRSLVAVLLALTVVFFAFGVTAFADEDVTTVAEDETTVAEDETTAAEDATTVDSGATEETTTAGTETDKKSGLSVGQIVAIAIGGVLAVAIVVLVILVARADDTKVYPNGQKVPFPARIKQGLRNFKSELHKIVWYPWNQVTKSTLVVVVTIIAIAAMIGILDLAFSKGLYALGKLIG